MGTREHAFATVQAKWDQFVKELPVVNQAALASAARTGQTGGAVTSMCWEYETRLKLLSDCCVEQYGWETKHDPWPRRHRESDWKVKVASWMNDYSAECCQSFRLTVKQHPTLSQVTFDQHMTGLVHASRVAALDDALIRISGRSEEVKSSGIKKAQGVTLKVVTHAAAAIGGWLLHLITG